MRIRPGCAKMRFYRWAQEGRTDETEYNRLFRLGEWKMMVLVGEDMKEAIEQAGITGCRFTEIETVS